MMLCPFSPPMTPTLHFYEDYTVGAFGPTTLSNSSPVPSFRVVHRQAALDYLSFLKHILHYSLAFLAFLQLCSQSLNCLPISPLPFNQILCSLSLCPETSHILPAGTMAPFFTTP